VVDILEQVSAQVVLQHVLLKVLGPTHCRPQSLVRSVVVVRALHGLADVSLALEVAPLELPVRVIETSTLLGDGVSDPLVGEPLRELLLFFGALHLEEVLLLLYYNTTADALAHQVREVLVDR